MHFRYVRPLARVRTLVLRLLLPLSACGTLPAAGQAFLDQTASAFSGPAPAGISGGELTWGDFDSDNDLDLLVTGQGSGVGSVVSKVYRYQSGLFAEYIGGSSIVAVGQSAAAWADYDNDGDLDLVICGRDASNTRQARMYRFIGSAFTLDNTATPTLIGVSQAAVAWGDYDGDGDLDLAVSGQDASSQPTMRLYRNDGSSVFSLTGIVLPGMTGGTIAWGDYNGDGLPDLLYTGNPAGSGGLTRLYRSLGDTLVLTPTSLPQVRDGSAAWGDYDNDGDLDILLSGNDNGTRITEVYVNNGSGSFTPANAGLNGIEQGRAVWGDYNNDGWLDILLSGKDGNGTANAATQLYANNQFGGFTLDVTASLTLQNVNNGSRVAFGDYNSDRRLDIVLCGQQNGNTPVFRLYTSLSLAANTTPAAPSALQSAVAGSSVLLKWSAPASTGATLRRGLSYNYYIGTASADDNIAPAQANIAPASASNGYRRIAAVGAVNDTFLTVSDLDPGVYFWSVQTVDNDFEGSVFAAEQTFTITPGVVGTSAFVDSTAAEFTTIPGGIDDGVVAWFDRENDGDLDFIIAGLADINPTEPRTRVFRNNSSGVDFTDLFAQGTNTNLSRLYRSDLAIGDLDHDNDLDLVLCGLLQDDITNRTEVWLQTGSGSGNYTNVVLPSGFPQVRDGSLDLGDYDNDGDLDLLITGNTTGGAVTAIYKNMFIPNGSLSFTLDAAATSNMNKVVSGDAAFGDYNRDGFPDIVLTGLDGTTGNPVGVVYRNNGNGTFAQASPIIPVEQSSVAWGDINNDGYLDLAVTGLRQVSGVPTPETAIYRYIPAFSTFFPVTDGIRDLATGSVAWGDYDSDGFIDLLITGRDINGTAHTEVYRNTDPFNFVLTVDASSSATLTGIERGNAAWGDYDNDGKLDILLSGSTNGGANRILKIYRNIHPSASTPPGIPSKLRAQLDGYAVRLTWDPPLSSSAVSSEGYTYALYVDGPAAGSTDVRSPMSSLSTGYRRVAELGKAGTRREVVLRNLPAGLYTWSVQTIDQSLEGSPFAASQTFEYEDPTFLDATAATFPVTPPARLRDASAAFGDIGDFLGNDGSGDGFLDLVISGLGDNNQPVTQLFRYDTLQDRYVRDQSAPLPGMYGGQVAWGDYDHDNRADLLIAGESSSGPLAAVYRNVLGSFSASPPNVISLTGIRNGAAAWADIDADGHQDVMLSGEDAGGQPQTLFFLNQQGQGFAPAGNLGVEALKGSAAAWTDYNHDGYPDLIIAGRNAANVRFCQLYANNRQGGFVPAPGIVLPQIADAALDWGDYNADGWADLAMSGSTATGRITRVYRNNSGISFTDIGGGLPPVEQGAIAWGDYNNDGYSDLIYVGQSSGSVADRIAQLYRYDSGTQNFVNEYLAAAPVPAVAGGAALVWGDFDRNGKLDLLAMGQRTAAPDSGSFALLRNVDAASPTRPGAPSALSAQVAGFEVLLRWTAPSNVPAAIRRSLTYNVYIGTSPGATGVRSPLARLNAGVNAGVRKIAVRGTAQDTTAFRIAGLPAGTYFWSVQAVDADLEGGVFAAEQQFAYEPPLFADSTAAVFGALPAGVSDGDLAWADYDLDGDADLAVAGLTSGGAITKIYRNQAGSLTEAIALPGLSQARLRWGDLDRDNDPDLIASGELAGTPVLRLYRNDGGGVFTPLSHSLPGITGGSLAMADVDYDGDEDLLIAGQGASGPVSEIYLNSGSGSFTALGAGFTPLANGEALLIDYNTDGFPDVLLTGTDAGGQQAALLYRNTGRRTFELVPSPGLPPLENSRADWSDYDSDGYPDLLLSGRSGNTLITRVYRNLNGSGSFNNTFSLATVGERGAARWCDLNNDQRADFIVTGASDLSGSAREVRVLLNTGSGFADKPILALPLEAADAAAMAFGDYDGDGRPDLAWTGRTSASPLSCAFRLYHNADTAANQVPLPPVSLAAQQRGDTLIFSWSPPAGGLANSYALYIGTAAGSTGVRSPLAAVPQGFRRVILPGGAGQSTRTRLYGMPGGTYFWSVQSVNPGLEGSAFAAERTVAYVPPALVDVSQSQLLAGAGADRAAIAWADADLDGDLDLAVSGAIADNQASTYLLSNTGGQFVLNTGASALLEDLQFSHLAWADYDLDGDLDLILTGETPGNGGPGAGQRSTRLYQNDGSGSFTEDPAGSSLPDLTAAAAAWGDYDNDGDPDLFLAGSSSSGRIAALFRNDQGSFVQDNSLNINGVDLAAAAWADYDRDGDLDLAVSGATATGQSSRIFRNDGIRGGFTQLTSVQAPLAAVKDGSLAWADYDRDGFMDLLLTGDSSSIGVVPVAFVFRYDHAAGRFVRQPFGLPGIAQGQGIWGDFDEDGRPDIALAGRGASGRLMRVYRNTGSGFAEESASGTGFTSLDADGTAAWGDADGDGRLDLAAAGRRGDSPAQRTLRLYRNVLGSTLAQPAVPASLSAELSGDSVVLTWNLPPGAADLTFNVYVGSAPGLADVVSPASDLASGYRRLPGPGNAGRRSRFRLKGLEPGTYYWSVQSVNAGLDGSPFAAEQSFAFDPAQFVLVNSIAFDTLALPDIEQGALAWGDYDLDGDLDLAVGGSASTGLIGRLYNNQNRQGFVADAAASAVIADMQEGQLAWADYDLDGDLDLALAGLTSNGPAAHIYRNTGGTFDRIDVGWQPVRDAALAWGDYDNDGDPDLVLSGLNGTTPFTRLYRNSGNGSFANSNVPLIQVYEGDLAWLDLNRDSYLDLIVAGRSAAPGNPPVIQAYLNQGNGTFTAAAGLFPSGFALSKARIDVADANNDGYPDLAICGLDALGTPAARVFRNERNLTFAPIPVPDLPQAAGGEIRWADYDSDGYADLAISGALASGAPVTLILRSDSGRTFVPDPKVNQAIADVSQGAMAWGDYNNDRKPDLVLTGRRTSSPLRRGLFLYQNQEPTPNTTAPAPVVLRAEVDGLDVRLFWDPPPGYPADRVEGLSYNLSMTVSTPASRQVVSPEASIIPPNNGYRRVAQLGNAGYRTEWVIRGLEIGKTYSWTVQAIEPDFEGSPFDTVTVFPFSPPLLEDVTSDIFPGGVPAGLRQGGITLADFDSDGDLDIVTAGDPGSGALTFNYYENQNGIFARDPAVSEAAEGLSHTTLRAADYDNDGQVDLLLAGRDSEGLPAVMLYRWRNGVLEPDPGHAEGLSGFASGSADWGDYDQDGDYDLAVAGFGDDDQRITRVYTHEDGFFEENGDLSEALPQVARGVIRWADFDQDNDLDLLLVGDDSLSGGTVGITRIYQRQPQGFVRLPVSGLPEVRRGTGAWADVNNDGYPDFLISGETETGLIARLFLYQPASGSFAQGGGTQIPGVSDGSVAFGDIDSDGWVDFILAGKTGPGPEDRATRFYRNNRNGTFSDEINTTGYLGSVDLGTLALGDYDGDGKLDLFITGRSSTVPEVVSFFVFRNIDSTANTTPGEPQDLKTGIFGNTVTLSWKAPVGASSGLSYNLYLGNAANPAAQRSPMALVSGPQEGYRKVVAAGPNGARLSATFSGIPDGSYVWSVQAIDPDREGSPFAPQQSFGFENPVPEIVDSFFVRLFPDDAASLESYISLRTDTLVDEVLVHYKGIASEEWQTRTLSLAASRYTFTLTPDLMDEMGLEYLFEVKGLFTFDARTDTQYAYRYYKSGLGVQDLTAGGEVSSYNILAVPLRLDNAAIESVIEDDFGRYSLFRWRMWSYADSSVTEYGKGLDSLQPGRGYWLITRKPRGFTTGAGAVVEANDGSPYEIRLQPGWNAIGNPYPYNLSWQDVLQASGPVPGLGNLLVFEGNWRNGATLDAFRGGFVFAASPATLRIPVRKNPNINRVPAPDAPPQTSGSLGQPAWIVQLHAETEDQRFVLGGVGMHPDADPLLDGFDVILPPRLPELLELYTEIPEHPARYLSRSVVPPTDRQLWPMTLNRPREGAEVRLFWDRSGLDDPDRVLLLYHPASQTWVDMGQSEEMALPPGPLSDQLVVYFGPAASAWAALAPERVSLGAPYPNPAAGPVRIPLTLPQADERYPVEIAVLDLQGQEVARLDPLLLKPGFHTLEWDGLGAAGRRLPAGIYLCRLQTLRDGVREESFSRLIVK
ncbi:MAG: FG-GAP-like repeat-containing protein [Bacteroidia bacterium]|nr:FG-GAP-like repeat-containing protein [Bacteroidia bacterium]